MVESGFARFKRPDLFPDEEAIPMVALNTVESSVLLHGDDIDTYFQLKAKPLMQNVMTKSQEISLNFDPFFPSSRQMADSTMFQVKASPIIKN